MNEIWNLITLCRCCHSDGKYKNLDTPYVVDNIIEYYDKMLKETLDIDIARPPVDASYMICDHCIEQLRGAARFKRQVKLCEEKFAEYCKNEFSLSDVVCGIKEETDLDSYADDFRDDGDSLDQKHCVEIKIEESVTTEDGITDIFKTTPPPVEKDDKRINKKTGRQKKTKTKPYLAQKLKADRSTNDKRVVKKVRASANIKKSMKKASKRNQGNRKSDEFYVKDEIVDTKLSTEESKPVLLEIKPDQYKVESSGDVKEETDKHEQAKPEASASALACELCGGVYSRKRYLWGHIRRAHRDHHKCDECYQQFATPAELHQHYATHPERRIYVCDYCNRLFHYKYGLLEHIRGSHMKLAANVCRVCDKTFLSKQILRKHEKRHDGTLKNKVCETCGWRFADYCHLAKHVRNVHDKLKSYACDGCEKTFNSNKYLKAHYLKVHLGVTPFQCSGCPKSFASKSGLAEHLKIHEPNRLFKCKFCEEQFKVFSEYRSHLARHKNVCDGVPKAGSICSYCGKRFATSYSCEVHMARHRGLKFDCDVCGKGFASKDSAIRHKKIHDREPKQKVKCALCKQNVYDMQKHLATHTVRPFCCHYCGKNFAQKSILNRHVATMHLGVRRFGCRYCEERFLQKKTRVRHERKVHNKVASEDGSDDCNVLYSNVFVPVVVKTDVE